jgi:chromosomal replication initiation ATPase DnaA
MTMPNPVTYYIIPTHEYNKMQKEINRIERLENRIIDTPNLEKITLQQIKDIFAFCLETKCREADIVELRHFSRYFLCTNTKLSLNKIKVITNCLDHSTVIHSRDKTKLDINRYDTIASRYKAFQDRIVNEINNYINDTTEKKAATTDVPADCAKTA